MKDFDEIVRRTAKSLENGIPLRIIVSALLRIGADRGYAGVQIQTNDQTEPDEDFPIMYMFSSESDAKAWAEIQALERLYNVEDKRKP